MEPHQKIKYQCPFCGKETLEVLIWPGHTAIKTKRSAVAKSTTYQKKPEGFELLTDCSNCGKTINEIKRVWKEGHKPDKEKLKKRHEELMKLREEMKRERENNNK